MRVSKEKAAENRERILDVAARLFRERGFDGIGVADLMKQAGLTHGGFYGHFASKDELMALAAERAAAQNRERWSPQVAQVKDGEPAFVTQVKQYLSTTHRDTPGAGCPVAALGADAARQAEEVRKAMGNSVETMLEAFEAMLPGEPGAERRARAMAACSTMVGALTLARATADRPLSAEILANAARATLVALGEK